MHNDLGAWNANCDCVSNTKLERSTGKALSPTRGSDHPGELWANGDWSDRLSSFFFQWRRGRVREPVRFGMIESCFLGVAAEKIFAAEFRGWQLEGGGCGGHVAGDGGVVWDEPNRVLHRKRADLLRYRLQELIEVASWWKKGKPRET